MIEVVDFFSEQRLCGFAGNAFTGVISVTEPDRVAKVKDKRWPTVLRLNFHDVDQFRSGYTIFNQGHAERILEWLATWENDLNAVYVHCAMGVSRSAAIAMFIAEKYGLQKKFDYLRASRYNRHVYRTLWELWTSSDEVREEILARRSNIG